MIIILKKDGTIVTDDGNPVEGAKLENAAAVLADPKDGDTIVYDADAGMWVAGTGSGGSGGGILKVGIYPDTGALDKTWKEIHDAALIGPVILLAFDGEQITVGYLTEVNISGNEYYVGFGDEYFSTDSENGYPVS